MSSEKPTAKSDAQVMGLEACLAFERSMRDLTNKIHAASIDDIILCIRDEIANLVTCERVTIYCYDLAKSEIYSKLKDGDEIKEIRVPVSAMSVAGYVALTAKPVRIKDAYDAVELKKVSPYLQFDASWDKRTGIRTKQMLAAPILAGQRLYGVIQVINTTHGKPFRESEEYIVQEFAKTLGIAFHNQAKLLIRSSRYDYLLRSEQITSATLDKAQVLAKEQGASVDHLLLTTFNVPKEELVRSLREYFKCEYISFSETTPVPTEILENFSVDYLKYNVVMPVGLADDKVVVAMENPKNVLSLDSLQQISGREMIPGVSTREEIFQFIDHFYGGKNGARSPSYRLDSIIKEIEKEGPPLPEKSAQTVTEKEGDLEAKEDDSGIVRLVNQIIEQAYDKGASDIHIEPCLDGDTSVRIRVDGICHTYLQVPRRVSKALVARVKIMADLDIADRRLPQDGKIRFKNYGARDIELRVATLPTSGDQEDVVLRILPLGQPCLLDKIDMAPDVLARFKSTISEPCGMVLSVGPTGSGKTTTLHAALRYLNTPDTKIWTAEDPVEITQKGLRQVQVHPKIGLTFERCLRSFLRADPDIIMIGEMRDAETAEAAIEASLTGHIVFSTLHTNSAPETVTRLLALGVDPFALGDALLGVLAQRLVRKICGNCAETYVPSQQEWDLLCEEYGTDAFVALNVKRTEASIARGKGCERCGQTGYRGRLGIHEFLVIDDEIRPLIYHKAHSSQIRDLGMRKGMILLKQDGIRKVLMGATDFKEVRASCMQ